MSNTPPAEAEVSRALRELHEVTIELDAEIESLHSSLQPVLHSGEQINGVSPAVSTNAPKTGVGSAITDKVIYLRMLTANVRSIRNRLGV